MKLGSLLLGFMLLALAGVAATSVVLLKAQVPQPPGVPIACSGGVTVLFEGKPLSFGCVINIKAGNGILATPSANPAIGGTDLSFSFNSALIPTHDQAHHSPNFCNSTNRTVSYACTLPNKALDAYRAGDIFELLPDTACNQNCSVNIDGRGQLGIWSKDGATAASFPAGQLTAIWYDGKTIRLL